LLEPDDVRARNDRPFSLVGVDQVRKALEQGCVARTVAADQGQPVPLANVEVESAEQPAFALDEAQVFVREDRRSHAAVHILPSFARGGGPCEAWWRGSAAV